MTILQPFVARRSAAPTACAVLAVGLGMASHASAASWADPVGGWDVNYEASSGQLPDDGDTTPTWDRVNYVQTNIFDDAVTGETTLFMDRSGSISPSFKSEASWAQGAADDQMTIDMRFRLIGSDELRTQDHEFSDGDYQFQLFVHRPPNTAQTEAGHGRQTAIFRLAQDEIRAGDGSITADLGTEWHNSRIHIDWSTGEIAFYLDGGSEPLITASTEGQSDTGNRINFGHSSSTARGALNMSYLRFTNSELAAVPEPGSLVLLAAGALSLTCRRRG